MVYGCIGAKMQQSQPQPPKNKKRDPEGSRLGVIAILDFLSTRHPTACSYEWGKLLMISFNL
jgi:hypothetical protein